MKRVALLSVWWFLWYTVMAYWTQHGLRFPSEARCQGYGAGHEKVPARKS